MRVLAQQHSPSDVVVGSAVGYLIGRQVYKAHHNPDLAGASIGTVVKPGRETSGPRKLASPYVPMDSYVYPLLDQLIASGAARSGILGQRPWTRAECARLVEEASGNIKSESSPQRRIVNVLRREFADYVETESRPSRMIAIEELYTRALGISGTPLNDSFHFGQTLYNDYGRPYWEGFNNVTGISGSAVAGRFLMYGRGEYQHAPAVPGYSPAVAASLATIDQVNSLPRAAAGNPEANQFRLIEGYTGVQFSKLSFTVGKQSLWWGPVASGPWLFSNNAEPIYMGRFSLANPINLPWIFGYFGPFKFDTYFGKLAGHWYPRQPYTHGEKISFKPTPNLEFGFSRTMIIGGGHPLTPCPPVSGSTGCPGHPLTFGYFGNGFTTFSAGGNAGTSGDVGDNRGGFDFSYRVPKLRDWLTIYGDFFVDDDPSPLAAPRRTAINPGIYVAKLPFLHKLDFRAEAPMTAQSAISGSNGTFFYFNEGYRDGYTNKGFLLGNWVGRQAKGLYLSSRYMISPTANVQFLFRNQILDPNFITDGGTINDFRVTAEFTLRQHFKLAGFVQFERWNIPLLAAPPVTGPQHNVTTSVELKYLPNWRWRGD
jgi:hypothetical protein